MGKSYEKRLEADGSPYVMRVDVIEHGKVTVEQCDERIANFQREIEEAQEEKAAILAKLREA